MSNPSEGTHGPAKRFVDLQNRPGPDGAVSGHHALQNDLAAYDDEDKTDPYIEELLDVLDRVENEGEPYLEKLIMQAGLEFSSPDEDELSIARHTKAADQRVKARKKKKRDVKKMSSKVEMGVVEGISDDDYSQIYSTAKEGIIITANISSFSFHYGRVVKDMTRNIRKYKIQTKALIVLLIILIIPH